MTDFESFVRHVVGPSRLLSGLGDEDFDAFDREIGDWSGEVLPRASRRADRPRDEHRQRRRGLLPRGIRTGRRLGRRGQRPTRRRRDASGATRFSACWTAAIRRAASRLAGTRLRASRDSTSRSRPRRASACCSVIGEGSLRRDDPSCARRRRAGCARVPRAPGRRRAARSGRMHQRSRTRARRGGVPASRIARGRSAAAHARGRREPRSGRRRTLVRARRATSLRPREDGRLPLRGAAPR